MKSIDQTLRKDDDFLNYYSTTEKNVEDIIEK